MRSDSSRKWLSRRPLAESLECRRLLVAGTLDPTFDGDGILFPNSTLDFNPPGPGHVNDVEFAADGKVVVAGYVDTGITRLPAILRLNRDGTPDAAFSSHGGTSLVPRTETLGGEANAVAIQPDQKVIIGGVNQNNRFGLARFNADGSLDTTFAGDGIWELPDPTMYDVAAIEVLPDGKILATGGMEYIWVGRFDANGNLDPTFGFSGLTSVDPTPRPPFADARDRPQALTVDAAGRVVVVGSGRWQSLQERAVVARFNVNGRVDTTFGGGDGVVEIDPGALPRGAALAVRIEPDGRIIAAGSFNPGFFLARFLADGSPDATFGPGGRRVSNDDHFPAPPTLSFRSMEFLPDGRVVASGPHRFQPGPTDRIVVRRYLLDATPDATFGTGGEVRTEYGGHLLNVDDVAVTPSGEVVVPVATPLAPQPHQAVVARYTSDGQLDAAFGGGVVTVPFRSSELVMLSDSAETLDGKLIAFGRMRTFLLVVRFNRDGSLDTSFNGDGYVTVPIPVTAVNESEVMPDGKMILATADGQLIRLNADATLDMSVMVGDGPRNGAYIGVADFAIQSDGMIVTVTGMWDSGGFQTRRYKRDGTIDPTFGGGDGIVIARPGNSNTPDAITVLSDGGILVGGTVEENPTAGWALVRYRSDGTPDSNFGNQFNRPGVVLIREPGGELHDLMALPGAAFYAVGSLPSDFVLARFLPDGSLDPAFSGDGLAYAGFPGGATANWMDRQADGKIILGGYFSTDGIQQFAAARFNPDCTLDGAFGQGGRSSGATGNTPPTDMLLMSDGGIVFTEMRAPMLVRLRSDGALPTTLGERSVFYNDSAFDGSDPAPTPADLAAVAPDMAALRPGQVGSFSNVTSYTKGINGVIVEFAGIPPAELLAGDFMFRTGEGGPSAAWADGPMPSGIALLPGPTAADTVRYAFTWPDGAIRNRWLEVTVKANARTGLIAPDVFYFGHLTGDTGGTPLQIDATDYVRARSAVGSRAAGLSNPFDVDRDGQVTVMDLRTVRRNFGRSLPSLAVPIPAANAPTRGVPAVRRRMAYDVLGSN
jgi:uncharacterized delta-60 repeat protein